MSARSRAFWAQECKLTCLGGSERGTCACRCPNDCVAQHDPGFGAARQRAKEAMGRHLMNAIAGSSVHEILSATRDGSESPSNLCVLDIRIVQGEIKC